MSANPVVVMRRPRGRSALDVVPVPERGGWRAPNLRNVVIDDTYAYMTKATWLAFLAYDESTPTGVWPGKVWRCSPTRGPDKGRHFICWFGLSSKGLDYCSNNSRIVRIVLDGRHAAR